MARFDAGASSTAGSRFTRRELLRRSASVAAATGLAGSGAARFIYGPLKYKGKELKGDLSIIQWAHFVPAYDQWLGDYAKAWGETNDVQVTIDHINNQLLQSRAAAEVASQSGHDLFEHLAPPASCEDQVIDHGAIVQEITHKVGKIGSLAKRSTYNSKTRKWFGLAHGYTPNPVVYRHDYWNGVGTAPYTWDDVLRAAPKLKAAGHPIGIGMSNEIDSNMALMSLMMSFGSYIQDEHARVTINSKETVQALKFMASLYERGMTSEVFGWVASSNNNFIYSGKGSLIVNPISATRTPENAGMAFSDDLYIAPIPKGPVQRAGLEGLISTYTIWKFAKNKEAASKFLVDLVSHYNDVFDNSKFFYFPGFPGSVSNIRHKVATDKHKPHGKYGVLTTIAKKYTRNVGYPGTSNAAIDEMFYKYLIPQMFAEVAQRKLSAADAARAAERELNDIFRKWRRLGKI
jgi:multiple sugar transport system substrate-binding protein